MKKINVQVAGRILIFLLLLLVFFHIMVLAGVVPQDFIWGGRLETKTEMYQFETVALVMSLIFLAVIRIKMKYLRRQKKSTFINIGLWIILAYFVFNIVGNLTSKATLETNIFTPLSIVLSLLIYRLAIEK